jgi:AraC-like DNA-binding protein
MLPDLSSAAPATSAQPSPASPRPFRISTADLPEADRLPVWQEVHGRALFNLGVKPVADAPFHIEADLLPLGRGGISRVTCSPTHHYVAKDYLPTAQDVMNIIVVRHGRFHARQRGQEVTIGAGEAVALLANEIGSIDLLETGTAFSLSLPIAGIAPRVADLGTAVVRRLHDQHNAVTLLDTYTAGLLNLQAPLHGDLVKTAVDHLTDLVVLALGGLEAPAASRGGGRSGARDGSRVGARGGIRVARKQALKQAIVRNLTSLDLSSDDIAGQLGITPRYLRKLLRDEGTTFVDLVRHMRLTLAHRMLADPLQLKLPISTIAYQVGFSDLSYFNRCFRAHFHQTPSDIRSQAIRRL